MTRSCVWGAETRLKAEGGSKEVTSHATGSSGSCAKVGGGNVVCRLSLVESERRRGRRVKTNEGRSQFMGTQTCSSKRLSRGLSGGSRGEKSHSHCGLDYADCGLVECGATLTSPVRL